ncbi:MAG: hypothetical protein U0520_04525 [Candidatus Saccharimonadales bacterium]
MIQPFVCNGSAEKIKLVLANADVNGIAMGGIGAMIEDATHLFMEQNGFLTSAEVLANAGEFGRFLELQAGFLRDRLNDLEEQIAYYFHDSSDQDVARTIFQDLFQPGTEALRFALLIENPKQRFHI